MIWLMNKPPKGLESLVTAHFREKAAVVLEACAAYATGRVQVGYYRVGCYYAGRGTYIVPASFKASVDDLYWALLVWFRKIGARIVHLPRRRMKVEAAAVPKVIEKKPITEKKAKKGFLSVISGVLKKIGVFHKTQKKEMKNMTRQVTPRKSR